MFFCPALILIINASEAEWKITSELIDDPLGPIHCSTSVLVNKATRVSVCPKEQRIIVCLWDCVWVCVCVSLIIEKCLAKHKSHLDVICV